LAKAKFIFGKMLTKLSDLRELSDTHNHANLRLGKTTTFSLVINKNKQNFRSFVFRTLENPHLNCFLS
jgi:hypothetical protein